MAWAGTAAFAADPAGEIQRLSGPAVAVRDGGGIALAEGVAIFPGDHLVTAEGVRLEVMFRDGTVAALSDASELRIAAWQLSPDGAEGRLYLRLVAGSVLLNSGQLAAGDNPRLHLRTPVAVVGIRGTRVWAGPLDGRFGILLLDGGIVVENSSGRIDLSEPGTGLVVTVPEDAAAHEFWEPAEGWTGGGVPLVRGGPLGQPEIWSPDLVARALGAVQF